jgi:hypothetical protein
MSVGSGGVDESAIRETVSTWLSDVIAQSSDKLGRKGDMCPMMRRAVDRGSVQVDVVDVSGIAGASALTQIVCSALERFTSLEQACDRTDLFSYVVAFAGLEAEGALLDDVHAEMKDRVVARGLMFAQFHPSCDVRSVRNDDLVVGASPVPMLVFRRMAPHDIIFLRHNPAWVGAYLARFGDSSAHALDPFVQKALEEALSSRG